MRQSRYNIWVERDGSSYVYNGVSGALLRMSADDRSAVEKVLKDRGARDCSPELLKKMAVGRMLVPDDADEIELLTKRYAMSRYDSSHFALTIVTSLGCNFDCPYCFEAKHPSLMNDEVQRAVLEVLDEKLNELSSFSVSWF